MAILFLKAVCLNRNCCKSVFHLKPATEKFSFFAGNDPVNLSLDTAHWDKPEDYRLPITKGI